jgi:hypothetical protein
MNVKSLSGVILYTLIASLRRILQNVFTSIGARGGVVFKTLRYKPAGRGSTCQDLVSSSDRTAK